jgi:serine/threonine protein kinase
MNTRPALTRADVTLQRSRPLGRGGYGVVYRGTLLGKPVAIKTLFAAGVENPGSALVPPHVSKKLIQEVAIMCTLNHHNVVQVFGAVSECGWLVMELCPGGSLKALLNDSDQVLDQVTQLRFAAETALGVAYLHLCRIVHGDLKADNLLLTDPVPSKANIKLTDFGMAEAKDYSMSISKLDVSRSTAGTLRFTAPELLLSQATTKTFASDVYAMSITLWEIFERGTPYGVMPDAAVMQGITKGMRPDLRATPSKTAPILKGCWAQDVEQRWTATRAAMELIELSGVPPSSPPPPTLPPSGTVVGVLPLFQQPANVLLPRPLPMQQNADHDDTDTEVNELFGVSSAPPFPPPPPQAPALSWQPPPQVLAPPPPPLAVEPLQTPVQQPVSPLPPPRQSLGPPPASFYTGTRRSSSRAQYTVDMD